MGTYMWFVQLRTFNSRLSVIYGRWLELLHDAVGLYINSIHIHRRLSS